MIPAVREVIMIGGGIAGLSAAIYLGRAQRDTLVIDSGHSMAKWDPIVENYLGFPDGVGGEELLADGRQQAERYEVRFAKDEIIEVSRIGQTASNCAERAEPIGRNDFCSRPAFFISRRKSPGVKECLGHSMFFCKDCDGYRVRGKRIAICGANNEAVEYALGHAALLACVMVATNGEATALERAARAVAGGIRDPGARQAGSEMSNIASAKFFRCVSPEASA